MNIEELVTNLERIIDGGDEDEHVVAMIYFVPRLIADWRKRGEALAKIERWFGEFPESGRFCDEPENTRPMSYGANYGSNGERDFMRAIARAALTPQQPPQASEK